MSNFLVLSILKILIFFPLISNSEIFEGDGITCSEQNIQNDKQLTGLVYCEQDNVKWFSHIKNQKFNGYTFQLFNTGAMLISYLENGSMNSLGFYQKENFVEISVHEGAKRNGLGTKIFDINDPFRFSHTYQFKNNEIDRSFPVNETYYDQQNDRFIQKFFYLDDQSNYVQGSFLFEIGKSINNEDYRVSYIAQINDIGEFDGYGVKILNDTEITYGILKKRQFIKKFKESELDSFPTQYWDYLTLVKEYNDMLIPFNKKINRFLSEASESLSISVDFNNWVFLSQEDIDNLKKKYEARIKELNNFNNL